MGLFHKKVQEKHSIMAQQTGRVILLEEVKDPVFSQKVLGDGIAILPENGDVFAPVSGKIIQITNTLHAICIAGDDGIELLMHLGLDTVKLNGQGFTCFVKEGQHVSVGDRIIKMDLEYICQSGLQTVSPCIITNSDRIKDLSTLTGNAVAGKTAVMNYSIS